MKERKIVQIETSYVPETRSTNGFREQFAVCEDGSLWSRFAENGMGFGAWSEDRSLPPREDESEKEEG